jgi:hypothetical protein
VRFNQHKNHNHNRLGAQRGQHNHSSFDSNFTFKQPRYTETQLSNFIILPRELQNEINKSDDEKTIDFANILNKKPVFFGESFDQGATPDNIQGIFNRASQ